MLFDIITIIRNDNCSYNYRYFNFLFELSSLFILGRPFLHLCTLTDHKMSGLISQDELIHIAKMMSCILSYNDIKALKEISGPGYPDRSHPDIRGRIFLDSYGKDNDDMIYYKELNSFLTAQNDISRYFIYIHICVNT